MQIIKTAVLNNDGSLAYMSTAHVHTAGDRFATFLKAREDCRRFAADKRRKEYRHAFSLMNNNRPANIYSAVQVPSTRGGYVLTTLDAPHRHAAAWPLPIY